MDDLRELYQEVILDHSKRPRNFHGMPEANRKADGYNPLCGDRVTVCLHVEGELVRDVSFQGSGCSISTASASMMTDALKGKTVAEAKALFERFHDLSRARARLTGLGPRQAESSFVREYLVASNARRPWHTLKAALRDTARRSRPSGPAY
jgi:nitrogen fixation NifU-like protein